MKTKKITSGDYRHLKTGLIITKGVKSWEIRNEVTWELIETQPTKSKCVWACDCIAKETV